MEHYERSSNHCFIDPAERRHRREERSAEEGRHVEGSTNSSEESNECVESCRADARGK